MIGVDVEKLYAQEAKKRQEKAALTGNKTRHKKSAGSGNVASTERSEQARDKAAKDVGVGARSIQKAKVIDEFCDDDTKQKVRTKA